MTVALVSAVVSVAVSVAGAISGADTEAAIAGANQRSSMTAAQTKNAARDAQNVNIEAQNNLKRWTQSINNNSRLDAGGQSLGSNVTNYLRQKDQLLNSNFEDSISAAEQMGSQASSAAMAGLSGSVVDNINSTTTLKRDRIHGQIDAQGAALDQNYNQKAKAIIGDTISGLDNTSVFDNLDHNIDVGLKYASPTWFGKFLGNGGAQGLVGAGKSYFSTAGGGGGSDNGMGLNDNAVSSGAALESNGFAGV